MEGSGMKNFKLAMVQHDSYLGKKQENFEKTVYYTKKAKEMGASLVVFPELNVTGHAGSPMLLDEAEDIHTGPCALKLYELAKELDIYIAPGFGNIREGKLYNTQVVIGPGGFMGYQDKVHLSNDEVNYFSGGASFNLIELPFAKVGINICYDIHFPEGGRCLMVQGAELLLYPHAARYSDGEWNDDEIKKAQTVARAKDNFSVLARCRAMENHCYLGLCNMTGESGKYAGVRANHAGVSFIIDPHGKILAESKTTRMEDEIIVADISAEVLEKSRSGTNTPAKKRRPELYGILTK